MPDSSSRKRFTSLNALRGLAALEIAVYHARPVNGGYLAVDFFLVLSGFVLAHNYLYSERPVSTATFIIKRIGRLYPLHLFTLFTFLLTSVLSFGVVPVYEDGTWYTFFLNVFMIHNIGLNQAEITWNYPSWSISVEFWVNVLFIACITRRSPSAALLAVSLLGLSIIYLHTGHLDVTTENYFLVVNSGMLRGLSSFLLGILAYRIYLKIQSVGPSVVVGNLLETGSVLLALATISYRSELHSSLDFLAPFVFLLVVVVFALESGTLSAGLKKLNYLGEISYSIYLNQITVSQVLIIILGAERIPEIPMVLLLSIFVGTLILYSCLTYEYIENPLRRKSRPPSYPDA